MGLVKCVLRSLRNFVIFFLLIALLPGLPPKTHFDIESFTIGSLKNFEGPLALNHHLDDIERLFEGRINGAETILIRGNDLYTTVTESVVKISDDKITHIAHFGTSSDSIYELEKCGKPLGIAFDTISDDLIVTDAYLGIWSVDLINGKKTLLVSPHQVLDGKVNRTGKFFDGIAISKSGDIFWTDASSDFDFQNAVSILFANPSGRLFQYNRVTKTNRVLMDNLWFANGVALSPNEDFVLVSETIASRIQRYYLKGHLSGTSDIFVDGLPGGPDNITPDIDGIWVPLAYARDNNMVGYLLSANEAPLLRKFLLRGLELLEIPFRIINNFYPNVYCQAAIHHIGSFEFTERLLDKRSTIVRIDWNGNIIGSLHGFKNTMKLISHVMEHDGYLYLGSFRTSFIGKIILPENFKEFVNKHKKANDEDINSIRGSGGRDEF